MPRSMFPAVSLSPRAKGILYTDWSPDQKDRESVVRISLVAPGGRHTIMLTDRGEVFTCGSNDFGQNLSKITSTLKSPSPNPKS